MKILELIMVAKAYEALSLPDMVSACTSLNDSLAKVLVTCLSCTKVMLYLVSRNQLQRRRQTKSIR